jgi:FkbM family methyltransferase
MKKYIILHILNFFDYFYQLKILKYLKKNNFIKFDIFFDIGAHTGESINLFLKNFTINKIYSFEASPINFKKLLQSEKIYKKRFSKTDIIIENYALGNKIIDTYLNQSFESSSSTINQINLNSKYFKQKQKLLKSDDKNFFKNIEIKMITLESYMEKNQIKNIDFIKIDTEGYEFEILKGLKDKISRIKLIMFEHHYDDMIKKDYKYSNISKLLKDNNFEKIYKSKMPFRKTFEYIFLNKKYVKR